MEANLLLIDLLPSLVCELQDFLTKQREPNLAAQIPRLRIFDRRRCGDDFRDGLCLAQTNGCVWQGSPEHLARADQGMLVLDVVEGEIACVEVLYRDEVRKIVAAALP